MDGLKDNNYLKKEKTIKVIVLVLIFMLSFVLFFLIYEYFCGNTPSKNNLFEYVSIDSNSYLKLNENNRYELKITNFKNRINNRGEYTKDGNNYKLDNKYDVIVYSDFVEIRYVYSDKEYKYTIILFDKSKVNNILNNINNSMNTYFYSKIQTLKTSNSNLAEVTNLEKKVNSCFRYTDKNGTILESGKIMCNINYKIYLKDYSKNACINEDKDKSTSTNMYAPYLMTIGRCEDNYVEYNVDATIYYNSLYKMN